MMGPRSFGRPFQASRMPRQLSSRMARGWRWRGRGRGRSPRAAGAGRTVRLAGSHGVRPGVPSRARARAVAAGDRAARDSRSGSGAGHGRPHPGADRGAGDAGGGHRGGLGELGGALSAVSVSGLRCGLRACGHKPSPCCWLVHQDATLDQLVATPIVLIEPCLARVFPDDLRDPEHGSYGGPAEVGRGGNERWGQLLCLQVVRRIGTDGAVVAGEREIDPGRPRSEHVECGGCVD